MSAPKINLAELKRLEAKATPGPYTSDGLFVFAGNAMVADDGGGFSDTPDNAIVRGRGWGADLPIADNLALIAAMRNALPVLLELAEMIHQLHTHSGQDRCRVCVPLSKLDFTPPAAEGSE